MGPNDLRLKSTLATRVDLVPAETRDGSEEASDGFAKEAYVTSHQAVSPGKPTILRRMRQNHARNYFRVRLFSANDRWRHFRRGRARLPKRK